MQSERDQFPEQQQHYSPEEMMTRLKQNERDKVQSESTQKQQLVTREDGSQVVKVRRRKRRSHQPHKRKKKIHSGIKWAILCSVTGAIILLIAGSFYIIAKYNGAKFKKETESNIAALSGADEVTITRLRVTPASVKAHKIEFHWDPYSYLAHATFQQIEGNIHATSFLSSQWKGQEIQCDEADIFLKTPQQSSEATTEAPVSPYQFDVYRCDKLNLRFGSDRYAPSITGMRATLKMSSDGHQKIACDDGKMIAQGWPELALSSAVATLGPAQIEFSALISTNDIRSGQIQVQGQIQRDSNRPVHLEVIAKKYPIEQLLGKRLGMFMQGQISCDTGSLQYHATRSPGQALSLVMPFNSSDIQMAEFPMFADLKQLTGNFEFSRPRFNDCKAVLKRTGDGVLIDQIDFNSSNLISLKGQIAVHSDDKMSGNLVVQLPQRLVELSNNPDSLGQPKDGLYTIQVTLGGTIHSPHDNLREQLELQTPEPEPIPLEQETTAPPRPVLPLSPPKKTLSPEDKEKEFEELLR